jgi:uncharacterized membrane protein
MTLSPVPSPPFDALPPASRPYARLILWPVALIGSVIVALWLLGTPPGLLGKADAVGYAICHRIAARSFHAHDRQLPLCARCTGIYLGVMLDLVVFAARGRLRASRLPAIKVLLVFLALLGIYGMDGLNSYLSLFDAYRPIYHPNNTLRLLTGMSFGLGMMAVVLPVFNSMIWQTPQPESPLRDLKELAVLLGIAALVAGAVLIQVPALLLAAGLISAAGVVLMFGVVGSTMFLMVVRRENTVTRWRELVVPVLVGLVFAITVVGGIDLVRHVFTGTWDGFNLPG